MACIVLIQNDYPDIPAMSRTINYITRSGLVGGYAVDPNEAIPQMKALKRVYHQQDGVQLQHFIISFSLQEASQVDLDDVLAIGFQIGQSFAEYQLVYAIHLDSRHLHLHCVLNTVNFVTGKKYSDGEAGFWKVRSLLQEIFPKSQVRIYWSFPLSEVNRFTHTAEDEFLRLDN